MVTPISMDLIIIFFRFFFFLCTVSIEIVLFSAKCILERIGGIKKLLTKKNWMPDSKIFTFFKPKKKRPLGAIFGPLPIFLGRRPDFFGVSKKNVSTALAAPRSSALVRHGVWPALE